MDRDKLKDIYEEYPNKIAAEKIGVSVPTLLKMIDRENIQRKGSGRPYIRPSERVVE